MFLCHVFGREFSPLALPRCFAVALHEDVAGNERVETLAER
jgi:hypothetical protein